MEFVFLCILEINKPMITLLTAFMAFFNMAANSIYDFELPKTWEKDFTIDVSHHGSMRGGSTKIRFTYDSCSYVIDSDVEKTQTFAYAMTDKDRSAILKKLHSLRIDKIDRKRKIVPVHDGWSQSICFGFHCIQGGPSVDLSVKDKSSFLTAYAFLEQFAIDNTKVVGK